MWGVGWGGGARSSNKSVPSLLPLESPESLLHALRVGLAEDCVLGLCCGGRGSGGVGAIQFFSLVGYHVLVL